jgi:hypothetical protein
VGLRADMNCSIRGRLHLMSAVLALCPHVACVSTSTAGEQRNRLAVHEPDGSYTFYAGQGIADAVSGGVSLGDDYHVGYMALNVPSSMHDAAMQAPQRVTTISLEVPGPSVTITVHEVEKDGGVQTLYFHPADPWVSGYAQVGTGPDNFTMGFFEVIKWNKDTTGTMPTVLYSDIYTTGLLPDDNKPTLLYAVDPTKVPLPANWN